MTPKKTGNLAVRRLVLDRIEASFPDDKIENDDQEHKMLDRLIDEGLRSEFSCDKNDFARDS